MERKIRGFGIFSFIITLTAVLSLSITVFGQTQPLSERDEKFYIYSMEQLNTANKNLQEQLTLNQQVIKQIRTERDSLFSLLMRYQSGGAVPSQPVRQTTSAPANIRVGTGEFESSYRIALEKFNQRDYADAIARFEALLKHSRTHSLSDNAQYWIGEAYYAMKDYQQAIIEFEKVLTFEGTNKDDDAQLKLGLSYMRLNDNESSKRELTRLLSKYPESEFTELARKLLEGM